ncbi:MAG: glucosaminidase domain-containing protein [Peptostreptococcus anaerobius]|uniref:glucosaminidase domain-containing protein n=1 Tax=Peptostreptococcus anaerobius TaxID=1261 RepID=UPI0029151020|nr:glucosaminidase domain-containing protein [Peptostreptococcus anaerobius]MDU5566332.1 glucosaminidase domain-containing protein [Peptostreptococcus anaerobius]
MTEQDIFIDKVKDGAIAGWHEGKILPSVTIAQACLESGWGTSDLAKNACNLFGIKAKEDWKGESYTVRTAEYDKNNKKFYIDAAFRKYRNWQCSLVDHARFFHTPAWREGNYKNVIGEVDYRKACKALQSAGYATSQSYASQLIGLIEMYHLDKYDEVAKKVSAAHKKESEVKDMVAFKYKQISNRRQIGGTRQKSSIKFIVIHYTGNDSKGANAMAHYRYLQSATRYGSAHYFVDDHEIIQVIGDSQVAWAVGDNQGHGTALNGCTNQNSISVEMCVNSDGDFNKTLYHTIELTKELLRLYPNARVCRHWDVSRKSCPAMMAGSTNPKWLAFLEEIKKPRRLILDLSKDSVAKEVTGGGNVKQSTNVGTAKKKCVMYYRDGNKTTAEFIAQQLNCGCYKDNGKDLPNSEHSKYDIKYIGDLGKTRQETAKEACKKFLGWKL